MTPHQSFDGEDAEFSAWNIHVAEMEYNQRERATADAEMLVKCKVVMARFRTLPKERFSVVTDPNILAHLQFGNQY